MDLLLKRRDFAVSLCREAGKLALEYFRNRANLVVDSKGAQDWVSEADRNVETFIRQRFAEDWPSDGIFGEEHEAKSGSSGFDWVIDPIDGTTNFVNGIPVWTIVLAGVSEGRTQVGVIFDPVADEIFVTVRGGGATLNGVQMQSTSDADLANGTVAVGYSNRVDARKIEPVIAGLNAQGGHVPSQRKRRFVDCLCCSRPAAWLPRRAYERVGLSCRAAHGSRGGRSHRRAEPR